ncbi:MAG: hypothetical protein JWO42_408, partial [Chloroflexi bacterium]|nr:hypothetical protein [Chloroflexota bacterium]
CKGPHDRLVSSLAFMPTTSAYDRICVLKGGELRVEWSQSMLPATLRVGSLYVAAGGMITVQGADGERGGDLGCHGGAEPPQDGGAGSTLAITARHVIIAGTISANGGSGLNAYSAGCYPNNKAGLAGRGGAITLTTIDLVLTGRISADGGAGGKGGQPDQWYDSYPSTNGGNGGSVHVALVTRMDPSNFSHMSANGGRGGPKPSFKGGLAGLAGKSGTVAVTQLPVSAVATLPQEPPSPITFLHGAARPTIVRATAPHSAATSCAGSGDLRVAGTLRVDVGAATMHRYQHICVLAGARLISRGDLTLEASSVYVAAGGTISVDGDSPALAFKGPSSGRYATAGACAADQTTPHAGLDGFIAAYTASYDPVRPGGGAHSLALVANTIVVEGRLSAIGGAGQVGSGDSPTGWGGPLAYTSAGSGSGGSILLVGDSITVRGTVTVAGGPGELLASGGGDFPASPGIADGSYGCIKLFSKTLSATTSGLGLDGPSIVGPLIPATPFGKDITSLLARSQTGPALTQVFHPSIFVEDERGTLFGSEGDNKWRSLWIGPNVSSAGPGNPLIYSAIVLDKGRMLIVVESDGSVWRSDDYAATWRKVATNAPVTSWPTPGNAVLTTSGGSLYGSDLDGVFVSRDNGKTWKRLFNTPNYSQPGVSGVTGVVAAGAPPTLWATTFVQFYSDEPNAPRKGMFESSDGGASWRHVVIVPKGATVAIDAVAVLPSSPSMMFGWNDADTLLFMSHDKGHTWTRVTLPPRLVGIVQGISFDPANDRHLYVWTLLRQGTNGSSSQLFVSRNGGLSWKMLPAPRGIQTFYSSYTT